MSQWLRQLALCFAAGAGGALCISVLGFVCARYAIPLHLPASLAESTLALRVVEGGLWGCLFLIPLAGSSVLVSGLIWGLVITVIEALVLPLLYRSGLHLAPLPLLFAALAHCLWGLTTALLLKMIR